MICSVPLPTDIFRIDAMKNRITVRPTSKWAGVPIAVLPMAVAVMLTAFCADAPAQKTTSPHPLLKVIEYATASRDQARELNGYEAVFTKNEIVGRRMISHKMQVKIRRKPFSVYMKFIKPEAGQQVVFTEGKNGGMMTVKPVGLKSLLGSLELAPNSSTVMAENRHQITRMGMERTVDVLIKQWQAESKFGEVEVKYYRDAKIGDRKCKVIEVIHPEPRRQFKFHKSRLYIDVENGLPVRVEQFAFPARKGAKPPVVEQYTYSSIRRNMRLADIDFSTRNPRYGF
jgi:hypothetical protein